MLSVIGVGMLFAFMTGQVRISNINRKIEAGSERKEGVLCARHLKK